MSRDDTVRSVVRTLQRVRQEAGALANEINAREVQLRAFPGLPQPYSDIESHQKLLEALKEAVETLMRARGSYELSAVTLNDLERLGIIRVYENGLVTTPLGDAVRDLEARVAALENP